ncbi:MAG: glycosyltransferase [Candidatus Pacebacteria bacterium]|nr:glycosyltransferase [Candidatus Paceibacterota bacterium]
MKKILFVITKSNFGGAQRYVYDLVTHLPKSDYDLAVALGGTGAQGAVPGSLKTKLEEAGIRTIVIPHFMRDMSLVDDIRAFFELWHTVRTERPDVLHVTSSKAGGIGGLIGRLCGIRTIVFTSHGLTFDETWRPRWQRVLIWLFTWATMLLSTRTIQISRDTYLRARNMPFCRRKVVLIHNGIEIPDFLSHDEARKTILPDSPNSVYKSPWLGTIAEYHPNKNLDILIDAVALLKERGIITQLVLIGDGEEREYLTARTRERGVETHVHLRGYVQDASRYLQAFDIFTLPSRKEGLPYVLIEAGTAGLPCVVSNITGNMDIVEHEKTGLVVDPTAKTLADAFERLITHRAYAETLGRALEAHIHKIFSIAHMVAETEKTYLIPSPTNL